MPINVEYPNRYDLDGSEPASNLRTLSEEIIVVTISDQEGSLPLLQLPPWIKKVYFYGCTFEEAPVFPSSLVAITVHKCSSTMPLTEWRFLARVPYMEIDDCCDFFDDLSQISVDHLLLWKFRGESRRLKLPSSLVSLKLSRVAYTSLPQLPPKLRELRLAGCSYLTDHSAATSVPIKYLKVAATLMPDVYSCYPRVERLNMHNTYAVGVDTITIASSSLTSLKIASTSFSNVITLNTPNLERVEVNYSEIQVDDCWGDSVKRLILDAAHDFNIPSGWTDVETILINGGHNGPHRLDAVYRLPCWPWLRRFCTSSLVETNGAQVSTIDEYKQAWGQSTRKKGAKRQ